MSEKVALVTGTSSGVGLHTAVGLARKDIRVVATMRDTAKADRLLAEADGQGVDLTVAQLDVTDLDGARQCLDEVAAEVGPVEILVNNAGQSLAGTLEQLDEAAVQEQLDVNFLGATALARHVLPPMREAGYGRIVNVTSSSGVHGGPFLDAYCASKFALEGLMQSLAPVVARFGIGVSVVESASVASNIAENIDVRRVSDPEDPYGALGGKFLQAMDAAMALAQPAADAAAVVVEAATTDTPRFRWQTSEAAEFLVGLSLADMDGSKVLDATSTWLG